MSRRRDAPASRVAQPELHPDVRRTAAVLAAVRRELRAELETVRRPKADARKAS
jgi:hypothetical protein